MFRSTKKDLTGLTYFDLIPGQSPVPDPGNAKRKIPRDGTAVRTEGIRKDGSPVAIEVTTRVITVEGNPRVLLIIGGLNPRC
jgi:hypothetical protein